MKSNFINKYKTDIAISIVVGFMFFFFAPLELYFTNKREFFYDFYMMAPLLLLLWLIFSIVSIGVMAVIHKTKAYRVILAIYLIGFVCSYIQGNYMTGWLPSLDGNAIKWAQLGVHRITSIILWVIVSAVVFVLYRLLDKAVFEKYIRYLSYAIAAMLLVSLVSVGIANRGFEKKTIYSGSPTSKNILGYSEEKNFLILLVDKADGAVLKELLEGNPEYEKKFEDFTFYTNAEAVYPYTHHSIAAILTGIKYEKQSDYSTYLDHAYDDSKLFELLESNNYSMGVYETLINLKSGQDRFDNMVRCKRKIGQIGKFYTWQIMLTGYRYAPFDLKRFCYLYTSSFNSLKVLEGDEQAFTDDNMDFWNTLNNEEPVRIDGNNFRFIHIEGAHNPWKYDENMNEIADGKYEDGMKSCITIADKYIELYKDLGVYDNCAIIIMSDHGYSTGNMQENPLFLVKGFGESHELYYNDAPISYDDLIECYSRLLDGKSSLELFDYEEGDYRERTLLFQDDDDNPDMIMEEYVQTGHAGDPDTLIKVREF